MRQFNNSTIQQFNNSDGVTLYLAIVTMSGALAIALFMSSVFIKELRISQDIVNSIKAVYVADTVMEYALYQERQEPVPSIPVDMASCSAMNIIAGLPGGTAKCSVSSNSIIMGSDPLCTAASFCTKISATGAYAGINRRIEIVYPNL